MMPSHLISQRWRLALVVLGAICLLLSSIGIAFFAEQQYRIQVALDAQMQARVLADTATAALSFGDRKTVQEYVNALKNNPALDEVAIADDRGRPVAAFTRSRIHRGSTDSPNSASERGGAIVAVPVVQSGVRLGTVYLRIRSEPILRRLNRYAGPGLLVLMASLMFLVMAFDSRALGRANDDLQRQMEERQRAEDALRQSQKMEAVGRLTGGVAHDFNNMLAIVIGCLDLAQRRFSDANPQLLKLLDSAMDGARRSAELTQRLLAFSRLQALNPQAADIARSMRDMSDLLRRTLGETVAVETVVSGGLWRAHIDIAQLETSVLNLAINARDAMPEGGKLTIEMGNAYLDRDYASQHQEVEPGQYVMLAVTDTGTGMAPEIVRQVFEPFFTTKAVGKGTGLGLSQVHGFIRQSGGHVAIYSEVGVGTTVKLYLPRSHDTSSGPTQVVRRSEARLPRAVTILVVEDEAGVREFVCQALAELGYGVLAADGAAPALALLDEHPEISVLLTDVVMPRTGGRLLSDEARRRRPALRVLFMTGYTRNAIVHNGILDPDTDLLSKPFTVDQLAAEIEAVLQRGVQPPEGEE